MCQSHSPSSSHLLPQGKPCNCSLLLSEGSFEVMNVMKCSNIDYTDDCQFSDDTKSSRYILWHVNYVSVKLLFKKKINQQDLDSIPDINWTIPIKDQSIYSLHCCAESFSHVQLFVTPLSATRQASLSMGILQARTLEWGAMPSMGFSQPRSPALQADSLPTELPGKPLTVCS